MRYEHKTSYLRVSYVVQETGFLWFKDKTLPLEPDVELFLNSEAAQKHFRKYEAEGYGIVSVQPLLKAVVQQSKEHGPQPHGIAYPLTAGFVFFWQRIIGSDE
jgi:hypothetical protein